MTPQELIARARNALTPWFFLDGEEADPTIAEAVERAIGSVAEAIATAYSEALAEDREKLAQFMLTHSFATGHGDTTDDLLIELNGEIARRDRWTRAKAIEACIEIVGERAQELAEIRHQTERQMGAFDAVSALEDELLVFGGTKAAEPGETP